MTKKELQLHVEAMVETLAKKHGAKIVQKDQKVGGNVVAVSKAEGGVFDLDACRGILASNLLKMTEQLTTFGAVAAE